jgi:NAD(P)-dependent dehydrogenase (short-subunit alcohol dehydrogenase family)
MKTKKKILITGASDGIGRVTARELAARGHHVIIVGRDEAKTKRVAAETTGKVDWMIADLSRPAQVKQLAHDYQSRFERLDVLVNNAGAFFSKFGTTPDGIEQTFALNHLNYFFLTDLLLPLLAASNGGRVVNVASEAHRGCELDFDNLNGENKYSGWRAYQRSKLANILFTRELAKKLKGTKVTANTLHPGFVASKFGHNNAGLWGPAVRLGQILFAINEDRGAETSIFLADDTSVANVNGEYFDKCRVRKPSLAALNDDAAVRLWQVSEKILTRFR